ncbi:MAG: hypothetical protein IPH30_10425 [Betaproteobacteria bacterium]|nr:hypothetical protein [Betaproteobacteria bacterium]
MGYEVSTHAALTNAAFERTALNSAGKALAIDLGTLPWLVQDPEKPFKSANGAFYFNFRGSQVFGLTPSEYELGILKGVGLVGLESSIAGWLMRGAIREDDGGEVVKSKIGNPADDPFPPLINRFCNHFLDPIAQRPIYGRGFSSFCFWESPIFDSAQWTLGTLEPFVTTPSEWALRRNHYTVLDAREAMWRALTLTDKTGNAIARQVGPYNFTYEELRRYYWASTFRALGNVVHAIQDMGQPQHVRNEGHGLMGSGYEKYVDARARRLSEYKVDGLQLISTKGQLPGLVYDNGYPIPRFTRYSDYWSTRLGPNSDPRYAGLADYSNRGFFTIDSNIGNTAYPMPSPSASNYGRIRADSGFFGISATYLMGSVPDDLTNFLDTVSMSTEGVFAGLVGSLPSLRRQYTLSKRNYDDRANLLIPRAVAYSAGFIDYFFRGTMQVSLPADGVYAIADHAQFNAGNPASGFTKIKLKLANTTRHRVGDGFGAGHDWRPAGGGGEVPPQWQLRLGPEQEVRLAGGQSLASCRGAVEEIVVSSSVTDAQGAPVTSAALVSGAAPQEFHFTFPDALPLNVTDVYLQAAYRGHSAAGRCGGRCHQGHPEPTFLSIFNVTDSTACFNGAWK